MDVKELNQSQEHLPDNLKVKFFDLSNGVFKINNTTYYYQPHLKTKRNMRFEQLAINIGTDASIEYIFGALKSAHETIVNSNTIAQSLIKADQIIFNLMELVGNLKQKQEDKDLIPVVYEMAALLLVTEDEDTREINDAVFKRKYQDFHNSDYAYDAFFFLSLNHTGNFRKMLNELDELRKDLAKRKMPNTDIDID